MKLTKFIFLSALVALPAQGQAKPVTNAADTDTAQVKRIVERFCKMEVSGQWIGGRKTEGLSDFFTSYPTPSTSPQTRLGDDGASVVDHYTIGDPQRLTNANGSVYYKVTITYF